MLFGITVLASCCVAALCGRSAKALKEGLWLDGTSFFLQGILFVILGRSLVVDSWLGILWIVYLVDCVNVGLLVEYNLRLLDVSKVPVVDHCRKTKTYVKLVTNFSKNGVLFM